MTFADEEQPGEEWAAQREDAIEERVNQALRLWLEGMERAIEEASRRPQR